MLELLLGRRLRTAEQEGSKIGVGEGIPVLGLDALSSAAYGPEATLTVLLALGAGAITFIGPISAIIIALLIIVFLSYRQTIGAYQSGGGSYTVACENLGRGPGLLAAAALSLDYVLNVAVAIAAGVGAIVSAVPSLLPHTLALCLVILALISLVNLRGVREAGLLFMLPTYLFVGTLGLTIVWGLARALGACGHPVPVVPPPVAHGAAEAASLWLLLRAFASGCTAMTGVEAVSNAVPLFREPTVKRAEWTLTAIIGILVLLLAGIAYLAVAYHIVATPPGEAGYQSVLSQLVAAIAGRGVFYDVTICAVVAVLCLSANTSYADFPRLCRLLARDAYLPADFAHMGRRLVYTNGIIALTLLAGLLLVAFGGITDRLIPLFAIGAFLAFTLSQAGMVLHWRKRGGPHATRAMIVNGVGASATGITLVIITISKFAEGAWLTIIVIALLLLVYRTVRRDYERIGAATGVDAPIRVTPQEPPIVLIPMRAVNRVATKAVALGVSISKDVRVVHVASEVEPDIMLPAQWEDYVETPLASTGVPAPQLVILRSVYREFFGPMLRYVWKVQRDNPGRYVAVIVPELVEHRWYHYVMHSHRPTILKALLLLRGGPRVVMINAPWYLGRPEEELAVATGV